MSATPHIAAGTSAAPSPNPRLVADATPLCAPHSKTCVLLLHVGHLSVCPVSTFLSPASLSTIHPRPLHPTRPHLAPSSARASPLAAWTYATRDESPAIFLKAVAHAAHTPLVVHRLTVDDIIDRRHIVRHIVRDDAYKVVVVTASPLTSFVVQATQPDADTPHPPSPAHVQRHVDRCAHAARLLDAWGVSAASRRAVHVRVDDETAALSRRDAARIVALLSLPPSILPVPDAEPDVRQAPSPSPSPSPWDAFVSSCPSTAAANLRFAFAPAHERRDVVHPLLSASRVPILGGSPPSSPPSPPPSSAPDVEKPRLAILLPRASTLGLCTLVASLDATIPDDNRAQVSIYACTVVSDTNPHAILKPPACAYSIVLKSVAECRQSGGTAGATLCEGWNQLSVCAAADGCSYLMPLRDGATLQTFGWLSAVTETFTEISHSTRLLVGIGVVALSSPSCPYVPTAVVLHRRHLVIFNNILPPAFADDRPEPFLLAVYDRVATARVLPSAHATRSGSGGGGCAWEREEMTIRFKGRLLTKAIESLSRRVGNDAIWPTLDVVVPTFRLTVPNITSIISLRARYPARIKFWIVVDNPAHESLASFVRLFAGCQEGNNYQVRVIVHPENMGAGPARNTGLMLSQADWVIFMDDDVMPDDDVLNAYLAAMLRHEDVAILTGVTRLPAPRKIWEYGVAASLVTYFYDASASIPYLPWPVTANACVRGRNNGSLMFGAAFPKGGGGEDIDYGMRAAAKLEDTVAVPDAIVSHPLVASSYYATIGHVARWMVGDSHIEQTLVEKSFWVVPGWAEFLLLTSIPALAMGVAVRVTVSVIAAETALRMVGTVANANRQTGGRWGTAVLASVLASWLQMVGDATRVACSLRRRRVDGLFRRLDRYNGLWVVEREQLRIAGRLVLYCVLFAAFCCSG